MTKKMQTRRLLIPAICTLSMLAGCANMTEDERNTGRRTMTGTAIGAAAGAIIDDGGTTGIAVGAGVGALSGWLYDRHKKEEEGRN